MPADYKTDIKLPTPSKNRIFRPLDTETRLTFETPVAAYHLNRKEQTLGIGPAMTVVQFVL